MIENKNKRTIIQQRKISLAESQTLTILTEGRLTTALRYQGER